MITCSRCKKNIAIVFLAPAEGETAPGRGYCARCVKELNIAPIGGILDKLGMSLEQFENMSSAFFDPQKSDDFADEFSEENFENIQDIMKNIKSDFPFAIPVINLEYGAPDKDYPDASFRDDSASDGKITGDSEKSQKNASGSNASSVKNEFASRSVSSSDEKSTKQKKSKPKKMILEQYAVNLNNRAKNNQIDRVVGRNQEIERIIQILNRRTKNNPVLLGNPGVGKTAIAEGLALRIVEGDVPERLAEAQIYLLDFTSIVAGTQFRGQFESRLKNIVSEVSENKNIILVIDEVHSIVGAGDTEGAMSAANILKPALAKGDFQVIGITTLNEYRKHIEKDSALERRFMPVMVDEPNVAETVEIIKGLRPYYEQYHSIKISDDVIEEAVRLAERYITDRFFPDKAIDIIDEAGSSANISNEAIDRIYKIKREISELEKRKDDFSDPTDEMYEQLAAVKSRQCNLQKELDSLSEKQHIIEIAAQDVARVVSMWTKIPVQSISNLEAKKLSELAGNIKKKIIGQDEAVDAVVQMIRINRAGLSTKRKPSSFVFTGPTGVGKTELVKQLAVGLFDSEDALIRFDMSEFMEKHTLSKLIGAPPGYVGYSEAGQLTEKVRRHPYSIVLLDEIEKAHPDVTNVLLQILDDGKLTDGQGRLVNFSNTIVIMTSNANSDIGSGVCGFALEATDTSKHRLDSALKQVFSKELINRIDEIISFNPLSKENICEIVGIMLSELKEAAAEKKINAEFTDGLKKYIAEKGFDPMYGARPIRKIIKKEVEALVAQCVMDSSAAEGQTLVVDCSDGKVVSSLV